MYLLAESGSSKTDWWAFSKDEVLGKYRSIGINPDIWSAEAMKHELSKALGPIRDKQLPTKLFYYGASLRGKQNQALLKQIFTEIFPDVEIYIDHDLIAAARATCGKESGIACILGTGSNSCFYDGEKITSQMGGNGFILGDEGSGADLGKHLVIKVLDRELPEGLIQKFLNWRRMEGLDVRKEIHQAEKPNVYLAELSRFIGNHISLPEMQQLAISRFEAFLDKTVLRFSDHSVPVHFVGSIAYHYREYLSQACENKNLALGKILQSPIEYLVKYHQKNG